MRVLHVASEFHPFSKTGGLADMVAALAAEQARRGHSVSVITPLHRSARSKLGSTTGASPWRFQFPMGGNHVAGEFCRLRIHDRLEVFFLQHPWFDRPGVYGDASGIYPDNDVRFAFFNHAAVLLARFLPDSPHVVHGHDWQSGLTPRLLAAAGPSPGQVRRPATVLTIHNLAYLGQFPAASWTLTGLPASAFSPATAEFWGTFSFLKAGLTSADALTTVSPHYAREITTSEFGCGLEGLLLQRRTDLHGILNGVDYSEWKTSGNPHLPHDYSLQSLHGKSLNKAALQQEMGLPIRSDVPLLVNVGRLESQKGADHFLTALDYTLDEEFQVALLGSGHPELEAGWREFARRHPTRVSAQIRFDAGLAHRIEAGGDFFVMPSRFEPCGLNQMYSLRYGTVPIVRDTGGLHDSVIDPRESVDRATGIKFTEPSPEALAHALRKAVALWREPGALNHFRRNGMAADFSWERSATAYELIYEHLLSR